MNGKAIVVAVILAAMSIAGVAGSADNPARHLLFRRSLERDLGYGADETGCNDHDRRKE